MIEMVTWGDTRICNAIKIVYNIKWYRHSTIQFSLTLSVPAAAANRLSNKSVHVFR